MSEQNKDSVSMVAKDTFHSSQTGTVPARGTFETHRAHADDLIKRGLAEEQAAKKAPEPANKKAPDPVNKARK
jgi:hypothetical protein